MQPALPSTSRTFPLPPSPFPSPQSLFYLCGLACFIYIESLSIVPSSLIRVRACVRASFLFMAGEYSTVWTDNIPLVQTSVEDTGCFHLCIRLLEIDPRCSVCTWPVSCCCLISKFMFLTVYLPSSIHSCLHRQQTSWNLPPYCCQESPWGAEGGIAGS